MMGGDANEDAPEELVIASKKRDRKTPKEGGVGTAEGDKRDYGKKGLQSENRRDGLPWWRSG